jgi:hypothetical protein
MNGSFESVILDLLEKATFPQMSNFLESPGKAGRLPLEQMMKYPLDEILGDIPVGSAALRTLQ